MLDANDGTLCLDSLFFERPIVHKVKPLQREARPWQLEAPPPLSRIPATQEMQDEAESLSTLCGFPQKSNIFQSPSKGSDDLQAFPTNINRTCSFNSDGGETEETRGGGSGRPGACESLWGGEGFTDYFHGGGQSGGGEILQDFGHTPVSRCLSLDCGKSPPLRRSLFRIPALTSRGDSSTTDNLRSGGSSSQTSSRPRTFPSQVAMTTGPPSLQPPQSTVGHAAPSPPPSPLPLGSSAAIGRPRHPAQQAQTQDEGTKRAFVPPMTPQPLRIQGSSGCEVLRPVSEIPVKFRSIFNEFPFFNYVQSKALDDVLYTNKNFVACAPTGSGKTVLFELAIIRLLMETPEPWKDVKAVYMAPIKALCSQCFENWKKKFGPLGLICKELTGDTEIDDFFEINDSHIILTTPEKWDSMTRKWKDNCLLQLVRLFLIDEVHVVKDATRGATLEVVVSRMKAVNTYRAAQNPEDGVSMRFVAVSATIPNITDIADWLSDESGPAAYLNMDESHRPVKLRKVVLGFPCTPNQSEFKFDLSLNYKMANIIQTYSDQKPALVFCSTRKGVQQSAAVLAKDARFIMSIEHKQRLMKYANSILDSKLRDLVTFGVGFHHAGVDLADRKLIEQAFTLGDLPVLFTTRTLAMGVNLPAHLVVIKSTMQYVGGSCEEYGEADMLQMIGRAGRPQFDTSATAVIMTKAQTREKYMNLMSGNEIIESSLHGHLVEHLNAEIVLQTISDVNMALDWIRNTLLYIRALKNPAHYGFSANLDRCGIEAKLLELCLKNLNSLSSIDLISMDEDINIKPTEAGRLMARYCVAFDTMKQFYGVAGTETLSDLIELMSKSKELSDIQLRMNEKRALNTLNKDRNRTTIRHSLVGRIKTSEMKINCLIQAQLGSISIQDFGLTQDTSKIFRNGLRISKCLSEFLSHRSKTGFSALLNSLILAKCFRAKLWGDSPYVSKQLEKIGQTLSTAMVNAGLTSFSKIEEINARELELIVNRHPPFGNQIRESVIHLPKYEVALEQLPRYSSASAELVVKVNLRNQAQLQSRRTAPDRHYVSLIIGDSDNKVVFLQKLMDSLLLKCGSWSKKIDVAKPSKGEKISINLISSEYVGLDIQQSFAVYYSTAKKFGPEYPCNVTDFPSAQRLHHSARTPQSTNQAAAQKDNRPLTQNQDPGGKRQCNHFCKNKNLCAHDCCKVGVTVGRKRSTNQESGFSSYLNDLRTRCDTLGETPVKRLKMRMTEESLPGRMREFAYKPKEILPSASWCGVNPYKTSEIDLTADDDDQMSDTVCLYDLDRDPDVYVEDVHEPSHIPAAPYVHQQSSWVIPETSLRGYRSSNQRLNQTNTHSPAYSKGSTTTPKQGALCRNALSSQIPAVSFDLGNEWDDWGDFDEENLLHAGETSLNPSKLKPQIQQSVEHSSSGHAAASAQMFISSQTKPGIINAITPQSLIPTSGSPAIRKLGPSPFSQTFTPQQRVTLDWNKQRTDIFREGILAKSAENLPNLPHGVQETRRLDFFFTGAPPSVSSSLNKRTTPPTRDTLFTSLPSGRLRVMRARTNRLKHSFFPMAVKSLLQE